MLESNHVLSETVLLVKTIKWHRILGTAIRDMFINSSLKVELEVDLSIRKQLLDIVIIEKGEGKLPDNLPDGFNSLAKYNLITYKSMHESLNSWALDEFLGHFVNYRKQSVEEGEPLLSENLFKLYAISTRFPQNLDSKFKLIPLTQGLYQICWGSQNITIIVLNQIPKKEHNALWNVFSAEKERIIYGSEHYQIRSENTSTILNQLFAKYQLEGIDMPYTMEDFKHDVALEHLSSLSPEERLQGLSVERRLQGMSIEELEAYLEQLKATSKKSDEK